MDRKVSIIILNYNNWQVTINCLNSIFKNINFKVKIILIDNGSENNSVSELKEFLIKSSQNFQEFFSNEIDNYKSINCRLYFIKCLSNVGYACGNNIGLKLSNKLDVSHSLILNSDVLITNDFINDFLNKMSEDSDCTIISPLVLNEEGVLDQNCLRRRRKLPTSIFWEHGMLRPLFRLIYSNDTFYHSINNKLDFNRISVMSGACFFVDLEWFSSVNFFDSNTFLYEEEHILFEKIKKTNKKVLLSNHSSIVHLGSKSTNSNNFDVTKKYYFESLKHYLTNYRMVNSFYASLLILYISISEKILRLFR